MINMLIGSTSGKYESGNRPEAISSGSGDLGGKSYGAHQFIKSVCNAFVEWVSEYTNYEYKNELVVFPVGSTQFDMAWVDIAQKDPEGFLNLQHQYTAKMYYDPAVVKLLNAGYNVNKHSNAVKEMVFSRAVQYGAYYVPELLTKGMQFLHPEYENLSWIDDKKFDRELIEGVYKFLWDDANKAEWLPDKNKWHSPDDWNNGSGYNVGLQVINGLKNRWHNEKEDLIAMLENEVV